MKKFAFRLDGITPLILHNDDVEFADDVEKWTTHAKENKIVTKPGDDRYPAWKWVGYLYREEGKVVLPAGNLIRALVDAGKQFSDPTAKSRQTTLKKAAVTAIVFHEASFPILSEGLEINVNGADKLTAETEFEATKAWANERKIGLLIRRASVAGSKHVRVRPWITRWALKGTCTVSHSALETVDGFKKYLDFAGLSVGLGDWRPSSPKVPGVYGRFSAAVEEA